MIGVLVSATVLMLMSAGVFVPSALWLWGHYASESLVRGTGTEVPWLQGLMVVAAALGLGWVSVDAGPRGAKLMVVLVAAVLLVFFSLTLTWYGVFFEPFSGLAAAALAFATGLCFAETPGNRARRELAELTRGRASAATLVRLAEAPVGDGVVRELAVLVVRPLGATGTDAAARLSALRRLVATASDFLLSRPGALLDVPQADAVRVFFGMTDGSGGREAVEAALALRSHLAEKGYAAGSCGIAVTAGLCLLGRHGPDGHPVLTATGATAENARALAGMNAKHGTEILLGRQVLQAAGEGLETRPVPGTELHELLDLRQETVEELHHHHEEAEETGAHEETGAADFVIIEPGEEAPVAPFPMVSGAPSPRASAKGGGNKRR